MTKKIFLFSTLLAVSVFIGSCSKEDNPEIDNLPEEKMALYRLSGDTTDVATVTSGGVCLMGGSTDVDEAFKWMIEKSGGGDFVVIRVDTSFAYNTYIRKLGSVNSVETIIISNIEAANYPSTARKIKNAEALFIAGGDQSDYVKFWKNTLVHDAVNYLINTKKVPVGGTSAGCAILGSSYFSAESGSVTSLQALQNPYRSSIVLGHNDFINVPMLQNTITDQHFSQREREGRLIAFLARMNKDLGIVNSRGIGVDEKTAVCIDENGKAVVFGTNDAFFMSASTIPEMCESGTPLTWDNNMQAVKTYKISGSTSGNGYFDVTDYNSFSGGTPIYYYVKKGVLSAN